MDKLITNRKASINQVKTSKVKGNPSKFLTGVSYYPNRPKRVVSHNVRGCFLPGTVLFVAIPYIGLEPASSARYRMKSPPGENALALGEALTAYHLVDNLASSYISSLGLPEYHFRKLKGNAKVEQTEFSDDDDDDKKEVLVVHQVWFMVLDDGSFPLDLVYIPSPLHFLTEWFHRKHCNFQICQRCSVTACSTVSTAPPKCRGVPCPCKYD